MSNVSMHFIGFLANVDNSILRLKLSDDFIIEKLSQEKIRPFLDSAIFHYSMNDTCEVFRYCITRQHISEFQATEQGGVVIKWGELERIHRNIGNKLRLLRLFKEGNIFLPFSFLYHVKEETPQICSVVREWPLIDRTVFRLTEDEISQAELFIEKTKVPFPQQFLQLAFDAFDLSYETHIYGMAFLSLMISLEAMFNKGGNEISYSISRNTAVLLGESREESEQIFEEIRKFYSKRSKLIHGGDAIEIKSEDILKLRDYVRKAIKEVNYMDYAKEDLIRELNKNGFGCRPWRKKNSDNKT